MATTNAYEDCKIVMSMAGIVSDGGTLQDWIFHNRGRYVITMAKAASLWEKAKEASESDENWSAYILKMADIFTKTFIREIDLLEENGGDAELLTSQITATLSECWG